MFDENQYGYIIHQLDFLSVSKLGSLLIGMYPSTIKLIKNIENKYAANTDKHLSSSNTHKTTKSVQFSSSF
jgi:hypothetical protein